MMEHENASNGGPAMSDEQAADLRRLELAASEPNVAVQKLAEAEQAHQVQQEQSLVEKNAAALSMICELATPVLNQFGFKTVAGVFEAAHEQADGMNNGQVIAAAWAPVLAKYGVDLSSVGDKYKLEIGAVMMTWPVAKALYAALKVDAQNRVKMVAPAPMGAPDEAGELEPVA